MSSATLDAIRAKLKENQNKGKREENAPRASGDNASFPFWNIPFGSSATIRFLPDGDKDNVFFWQKREVIRLPFEGVVGGDYPTDKKVNVTVPCIDMFGMSCPIIAHIRPWWKGSDEEKAMARLYYKKKSYIFQGFVVQSPLDETPPENPIRRFVINPSLYEIIERSVMDPEMEDAPTDYQNGCDFKIAKTQKGDYANYQTSTWARRSRSLTEAELIAIDQYGLFNLKDYLGRVPDTDEVEAIKAMLKDSLDGAPFDMASYGKYYRPYGSRDDGEGDPVEKAARTAVQTRTAAAPIQESISTVASATASADAPAGGAKSSSAQELLDRIAARRNRT